MDMRLKKAFINLQTGVIGLKELDESGRSYSNNILRLLTYNNNIHEKLIIENDFKDYQLHYTKYQPKYGDLVRQNDMETDDNQILWFLSFREYFRNDFINVKSFSLIIKRIVKDKSLRNFLKENNLTLKICTHLLFENNVFEEFLNYQDDLIKVVDQKDTELIPEIAKSKLLITDYSPIVYDFSFVKKPYILFQPDYEKFIKKRKLYYDEDEMKEFVITKPSDLISKILSEDYETHEYIERVNSEKNDFEYVKQDKHLDDLYDYLKELQENKITFIGYNFYGIGGTVNATMSLAESLLQEGYFVNVLSLKRLSEMRHIPPYGLNMEYITWDHSGSIKEKVKRKLHKNPKNYSHLKYDYVNRFLPPYAGHELDNIMKSIKSKTVVSTRETLHLFLNECSSENTENKIFFFHTPSDMMDDVFPGVMEKINEFNIEKAIFITGQNRLALKHKYNYDNYNNYIDLGNTLIQEKMIKRDEITPIEKKDKYSAIYLLRISKGRERDLDNLIEFGKYVKNNDIDYIEIDVFGDGDYVEEFVDLIETNDLSDIIHYKLSTETPIDEIRLHDLMIDFSFNHSFGMIYIEAIFNGKKVFGMENPGSREVMENIPNSYIKSYEWLCEQIKNLDKITVEELKENYDKVNEKYSQHTIARKFLDFID